jgi:hypothetical protein
VLPDRRWEDEMIKAYIIILKKLNEEPLGKCRRR